MCEKLGFGPSVIPPCPHKMGAITLRGRDLSGACLSCSTKQFEGDYSTSQNCVVFFNLTLCFQFFAGDGICSPKCSCTPESNHSSPAATQNTTGGDGAGEISACFFSKHMFLITSKQLEFSCPPHIQHSSSPHPTFHTPTPLLSHSYLPVEEFIWLAVLRQKQRGKTDRKRSFGGGRR